MRWLYKKVRELGRVFPQVKLEHLKPLPIPIVGANGQASVIELINDLLAAKRDNPQADTKDLEIEIDRLVYKLYDLTPEEIQIVEGGRNE